MCVCVGGGGGGARARACICVFASTFQHSSNLTSSMAARTSAIMVCDLQA